MVAVVNHVSVYVSLELPTLVMLHELYYDVCRSYSKNIAQLMLTMRNQDTKSFLSKFDIKTIAVHRRLTPITTSFLCFNK